MQKASIQYHSRNKNYKTPFGAVSTEADVTIRLLVSQELQAEHVQLVIKYDRHDVPAYYPMAITSGTPLDAPDWSTYEVTLPIHDAGLYWYHFEILTPEKKWFVGRDETNQACLLEEGDALSTWQLTVYHPTYSLPQWIYGGVYYHIFVDRFYHAGPKVELPGKKLHDNWEESPDYLPVNGRIYNNDFFGGNLKGIQEKLPYLQELGVTCLYLSPVFEAYSNHKYDTGDYSKIDPMFGTEEDFRALCQNAKSRGIHIICDGVFSHTGSDSIYFDKYHHYNQNGAWMNPDSPYRNWYYFHEEESYETWWGIDTLPRINKDNPDYQEYICGKDGIIRKWIAAGASGWRLDVVDELPSAFLEKLVAGAKAEKPDALIVGEVWEDASNKKAYDERKNYFEGNKLDTAMNYPFRTGIIDFVRNGNAASLSNAVEEILENYPPNAVHSLMNLLGTHDSMRILTALAGQDLGPDPSRDLQAATKLSPQEWSHGIDLLKIAVVLQMTLPGVPCVYYGDEAGTEGYKDPFNRTCYPWGNENKELQNWYRKVISIRRSNKVYQEGSYETLASRQGLYAFVRYEEENLVSKPRKQRRKGAQNQATNAPIATVANCGTEPQELTLAGRWMDLLHGDTYEEQLTVNPGEVLLLQKII